MNFMRNIGMSVGTSIVTTLLARRGQFHQSILAGHTNSGRLHAAVEGLSHRLMEIGLSSHEAQQQAVGRMYQQIIIQAQAISYLDIYWLSAVAAALMFLASFVLKNNKPGTGATVVVH